jgi:hypothetical protein
MCVKGSANPNQRRWESYGPLDTHGYLWQVIWEAPTPFPLPVTCLSGEDLSFSRRRRTMRADRTPRHAPRARGERMGPRRTADHQEDRVRALPYDLPKATTRVKGPVSLPALLVAVGGPLDTCGWGDPGHTGGHEAPHLWALRAGLGHEAPQVWWALPRGRVRCARAGPGTKRHTCGCCRAGSGCCA